ncbi:MAG: MbcA/ParS/Xre antitoxin family protein [Cyclobacteriaceae bacterium]
MKKGKEYAHSDDTNVLNEPAVAYGQVDYFTLATHHISKSYIKSFLKKSQLSLQELIELVPISIDTYKRKTDFNPSVTEKVLEMEEVYKKGISAFGDGFYDWMDSSNPALGGVKPKSLLTNSFGIRRLLDEIGRIEHGVLA